MKRSALLLLALIGLSAVVPAAQAPRNAADPAAVSGPRLIVLITVDQFRYDYLTRFGGAYTSGLSRLLRDGAVFTDAHLEHYPTVTAIGHATSLTGAIPAVSGIIGNDWFDRETGVNVASILDTTVQPVGAEGASTASPRRLLVSTLGDELKLASPHPKGSPDAPRVIGVSLKDRSAILNAGRAADGAYWWHAGSGTFVTSTYYSPELPPWVRQFNERRMPDTWAGRHWTSLTDPALVLREMPQEPGPSLYSAVNGSAYGNDLLLAFAEEALVQERLGQRGALDVFSVSFSSNDSVGHTHGPDSAHVHDISVRTDHVIGALLDRIDTLVGLQHTIVAFTSDHGVAPLPEDLQARGMPGGRMTSRDIADAVQQALVKRYREGQWVLGMAGSSVYLNYELIDGLGLERAEVRQAAAAAAATVPRVTRVYTRDALLRGDVPSERLSQRVLRGFNAQRSGDLEILLEPYWLRQATGTTHGSPYVYDSHIPLILMGPRIKAGQYSDPVALNDLAPTLATLVGAASPSGSSGRVLTEALLPPAQDGSRLTRQER